MGAASRKGNLLEDAVQMIEQALLQSSDGDPPQIERRKIITHAEVHHEIDLYVVLKRPHGYNALYIFECKNWRGKVGKNDILEFSYKVEISGAQRGFFVATHFTKDAIAQAALDKRIVLLNASALEFETGREPTFFHYLGNRIEETDVNFFARDLEFVHKLLDIATANATLDLAQLDLRKYAEAWANEAVERRMANFPGSEEGEFSMVIEDKREYASGQLVIEGFDYAVAKLTVRLVVQVVYPRLVAVWTSMGEGLGSSSSRRS